MSGQEQEQGLRNDLYGFEVREHDRRRVEQADRKTYDIKQLWSRSHEVLNLAALGYKNTEIAQLLGITPATVSNTLNGTLGQQKLSSLRKERDQGVVDVLEEVQKLFPTALKVYEGILEDENATLRLKKDVADTILMDLGGHRSPTKVQNQVTSMSLTRIEIEEIKKRGLEAARASGLVIDLPPSTEGRAECLVNLQPDADNDTEGGGE
jgi:predicted transcriptional regulator